jgi:hypothetical protein
MEIKKKEIVRRYLLAKLFGKSIILSSSETNANINAKIQAIINEINSICMQIKLPRSLDINSLQYIPHEITYEDETFDIDSIAFLGCCATVQKYSNKPWIYFYNSIQYSAPIIYSEEIFTRVGVNYREFEAAFVNHDDSHLLRLAVSIDEIRRKLPRYLISSEGNFALLLAMLNHLNMSSRYPKVYIIEYLIASIIPAIKQFASKLLIENSVVPLLKTLFSQYCQRESFATSRLALETEDQRLDYSTGLRMKKVAQIDQQFDPWSLNDHRILNVYLAPVRIERSESSKLALAFSTNYQIGDVLWYAGTHLRSGRQLISCSDTVNITKFKSDKIEIVKQNTEAHYNKEQKILPICVTTGHWEPLARLDILNAWPSMLKLPDQGKYVLITPASGNLGKGEFIPLKELYIISEYFRSRAHKVILWQHKLFAIDNYFYNNTLNSSNLFSGALSENISEQIHLLTNIVENCTMVLGVPSANTIFSTILEKPTFVISNNMQSKFHSLIAGSNITNLPYVYPMLNHGHDNVLHDHLNLFFRSL